MYLISTGSAGGPLIIDTTPPFSGMVYDGDFLREDRDFMERSDIFCTQWKNFYDPHTGIQRYILLMLPMLSLFEVCTLPYGFFS